MGQQFHGRFFYLAKLIFWGGDVKDQLIHQLFFFFLLEEVKLLAFFA